MEKSPEKAMKWKCWQCMSLRNKRKKKSIIRNKRKEGQWTTSHLKIYSSSGEPLSAGSPALEAVHESMDKEF